MAVSIFITVMGDDSDGGQSRLASAIAEALKSISSAVEVRSPANLKSGGDMSNELWAKLTPEQRAILQFVKVHESASPTFCSIAMNLELPHLPGAAIADLGQGRMMSDKTVRRHCQPLVAQGLLIRRGVRGPLQLGPRGHELLDRQ